MTTYSDSAACFALGFPPASEEGGRTFSCARKARATVEGTSLPVRLVSALVNLPTANIALAPGISVWDQVASLSIDEAIVREEGSGAHLIRLRSKSSREGQVGWPGWHGGHWRASRALSAA
jgi:hypothetical protein